MASVVARKAAIWRSILAEGYHTVAAFSRHVALRFIKDGCFTSAGALSYTTLVSLIPLTAIVLAVLSAFPIFADTRDQMLATLFTNFVPQIGTEIEWWFRYFAGVALKTTAFGVVALAFTSILLLAAIEEQLNAIWRVTAARPWFQRVLIYWTILTLGPILLGVGLSFSGYFDLIAQRMGFSQQLGDLLTRTWFHSLARLLPFVLEAVTLVLVYCLIPNRTVRWREALVGGVIAALLIEPLKIGFGIYILQLSTYRAVYGALAAIPIFLAWMYILWCVILVGAVIAAALPEWRVDESLPKAPVSTPRLGLALALLAELFAQSRRGGMVGTPELAQRMGVNVALVDEHLALLKPKGLVAQTAEGCWVLARQPENVMLMDIYEALKLPLAANWRGDQEEAWHPRVASAIQHIVEGETAALRVPLGPILAEIETSPRRPQPIPSLRRTS